jgi:hypothetical protein
MRKSANPYANLLEFHNAKGMSVYPDLYAMMSFASIDSIYSKESAENLVYKT